MIALITGKVEEVPKKGLFSLPFMSRALQRQKLEVQEQAEETLREIQEEQDQAEEEEEGREFRAGSGRTASGPGNSAAGGPTSILPASAATAAQTAGRLRFRGGGKVSSVPFGFEDLELDLKPFEIGRGSAASDEDDGILSDADEDVAAKAERLQSSHGASASGDDTIDQRSKHQRLVGKEKGKGKQQQQGGGLPHPTQDELRDLEMALGEDGGLGATAATMSPRTIQAAIRPSAADTASRVLREGLFSGADRIAYKSAASSQKDEGAGFIAAKGFSGSRPGMVFMKGPKGLGYYPDPAQTATAIRPGSEKNISAGAARSTVTIAGSGSAASAVHKAVLPGVKQHQLKRKGLGEGATAELLDDSDGGGRDDDDNGTNPLSGSREGMRPAPGSKAAAQKDLIAMAFAGIDVLKAIIHFN